MKKCYDAPKKLHEKKSLIKLKQVTKLLEMNCFTNAVFEWYENIICSFSKCHLYEQSIQRENSIVSACLALL